MGILAKDKHKSTSIVKARIEIADMSYKSIRQKTIILVIALQLASLITVRSEMDDWNTHDFRTTEKKTEEGKASRLETNQSGLDDSTDEGGFECDYRSLDGIIGCFWLLWEGGSTRPQTWTQRGLEPPLPLFSFLVKGDFECDYKSFEGIFGCFCDVLQSDKRTCLSVYKWFEYTVILVVATYFTHRYFNTWHNRVQTLAQAFTNWYYNNNGQNNPPNNAPWYGLLSNALL